MAKQAILVVSFGTTKDETREKTIGAVEKAIALAFPGFLIQRAFTSSVVIKRLAARGIAVKSVERALEYLVEAGVEKVFIQPTHLIPGEEYEKLLTQAAPFAKRFGTLAIAKPLLYDTEDFIAIADAVGSAYKTEPGEALLLMGHGSAHFAGCIYPAMTYVLRNRGLDQAFLATVEGYPDFDDIRIEIARNSYQKVRLVPFMLVAGDHAMNDMAGDEPDSWKNRCAKMGITPHCILAGLGELEAVREVYVRHLQNCMEDENG